VGSLIVGVCNVISTLSSGDFRLHNTGGRRVNCSVLLLHPELIEINRMDIGKNSTTNMPSSLARKKTWPLRKRVGQVFVEFFKLGIITFICLLLIQIHSTVLSVIILFTPVSVHL